MKMFAKAVLIVLFVKITNGGFEFCDKENTECSPTDFNGTSELSFLVKNAIQYFSNLNQNYHNKINALATDIDSIKNFLQSDGGAKRHSFVNPIKQPLRAAAVANTAKSLYDNLWVVIQRRQDGGVSFYRSWVHYVVGFGNPLREFFIGLDKIHALTNSRPHELTIKLEDFKGNQKYARYDYFLVGNESEKYQLKKLGEYSGSAGDYLRNHVGMSFSTRDKDHDASESLHCARIYQGGWWYHNCMTSNLNGPFRTRYEVNNYNITWGKLNATQYKFVQMMIRSKG